MAEEAERSSSGANLLDLILKVETERAEKYRNILLQLLAGEDNVIGVSRVLPGGASTYPTLGAPSEQAIRRPPVERGGTDRNNRPAAEDGVAVATQSAAVPSASSTRLRISTSTGGSSSAPQPPTTREREMASHGRSARSSTRTLPRSSFSVIIPTATVNGPTRMQPQRTRSQSSWQETVPTPSPFVLTGNNELRNFISTAEIYIRAGLTPLGLTRAEIIRSEETQGVTWGDFHGLFGGNLRAEWVECQKIPGYKTFLSVSHIAQPYLPTGTGKPGLILRPPTITCTPDDDNVAFHVFSCSPQDNLLYYQGEYTKVPLPQIQISFCDLPVACRKVWIKRLSGGGKRTHVAIRARIKLRNQHNQEPSVAKVQEYLRRHPTAPATQREVYAAFRAGEEKMLCYGIRCTTYDSNLATIIQRNGTSDNN